ncbi:MAG: PAQR family membrane homeostasis protein TrhA [Sphaerochaetaceae bacterium]|jgi:hemolysin III
MTKILTWVDQSITLHNKQTSHTERLNGYTHLAGSLFALVFMAIVITQKASYAHINTFIGLLVYGLGMFFLFTCSTFYHMLNHSLAKKVFRLLDHVNIYSLIASTYTPILLFVDSPKTHLLTLIMWLIAFGGMLFSAFFWGKFKILEVAFYVAMGWMILLFWGDVVPFIPSSLTRYIVAAGLTYTSGVIFYARKKRYSHVVWHLFVFAASVLFAVGFLVNF